MAESIERVIYQTEIVGQQRVADGYRNIANAIDSSERAADQLSQRLRAEARIAEVAQRASERAASAARVQAVASNSAAKVANDNFATLSVNAARGSQALGAFGSAAAAISPEMGVLGASVSRASGVIGAMTASLGGAAGIAAGGLVAAVGAVAYALREASKDMAAFREEVDKANAAADEAFFERGQRYLKAQADQAAKLAQDLRLSSAEASVGGPSGASGSAGNTAALAAIAKAEKEAFGGSTRDPNAKPFQRPDAEFDAVQRREENDARIRALDDQAEAYRRDQRDRELAAANESKRAETDAYIEELDRRNVARQRFLRQSAEEEQRNTQLTAARWEESRKAGMQVYSSISGAAAGAFAQIAAGQKVTLAAFLQSLGSQMVGEGTKFIFEGLAFTLLGNPAGPGLLAVGGAEVAAGAALAAGGGAAAPSAPSGGGGAGAAPYGGPAAPAAPSTETGAQAPQITYVNNQFPAIIAPSAEDARRVEQAEAERRRLGL